MNRHRPTLYLALFFLPLAVYLAAWGYALAVLLPRQLHGQMVSMGLAYREVAKELMARPETADFVGRRPHGKGWSKVGSINGVSWGYVTGAEKVIVWYEAKKGECRAIHTKTFRPFPLVPLYVFGGGLVAVLFAVMAIVATRMLRGFLKDRDDFLAAVAHDLTTPLVGMRRLIGRDDGAVRNLNERMLRIVENIGVFVRRGGGSPAPARERVDLRGAYDEAYRLFREDYRDYGGGADVAVEGAATALADATMTSQIIWNLLGNELKYAAPYGSVRVRLFERDGFAGLEVADEGPGMTKAQMKRAFDRYYRAKDSLTSGVGGFGIGLSTSRLFARAMGGELTVAANRPKGCVFTLKLPAWH